MVKKLFSRKYDEFVKSFGEECEGVILKTLNVQGHSVGGKTAEDLAQVAQHTLTASSRLCPCPRPHARDSRAFDDVLRPLRPAPVQGRQAAHRFDAAGHRGRQLLRRGPR